MPKTMTWPKEELESMCMQLQIQIERRNGNSYLATSDREINLVLQNHLQRKLEQVKAALHKIEVGTYGLCEVCGGRINPERLQALPYATTCIKCERKRENGRNGSLTKQAISLNN